MNPLKLARRVVGVAVRTAQRLNADHRARQRHRLLLASLTHRKPGAVLFLCYGNICRSPFAASLATARLGKTVAVASAGFHEVIGRPAPDNIRRTSPTFGVDSTSHASRRVSADDVRAADIIFVMDHKNDQDLAAHFPEATDKTFLLGCFGNSGAEIRDPYNLDDATTSRILGEIAKAVTELCDTIARAPATATPTSTPA